MSEMECRYAQIEKEALATTWVCENFANFILGKHIQVETDHKPLVPLLGHKQLDSLPPRILRFHLRLDRYSYDITHVPGKELYTADTLSRAPILESSSTDSKALEELAELCVMRAISHLLASSQRSEIYREAQSKDPVCKLLFQYCQEGWSGQNKVDTIAKLYWEAQGELTVGDGLLVLGSRLAVLESLQEETLRKLHEGHQGIKGYPECSRDSTPSKEPLISAYLPEYPWQKITADLFTLNGTKYLVAADYFSRYPEVIQLRSTTSHSVSNALKSIFLQHGIPEVLMTDNGPQFSTSEFAEFGKQYCFVHTTSSPHYPASNRHAEREVKTIKHLIKNTDDSFLALLSYRATPLLW